MIDLRSDTVTRPTPAMMAAMAAAELGDDVLDGDPTTASLEARAAELMGHEAAVFLPSGTMGNLIAALVHTSPGDEVVVESRSHVLHFEHNGLTALAGCLPIVVTHSRGHLDLDDFDAALENNVPRGPGPRLLWLENTANLAGGTVLSAERTEALCEDAHTRGLVVHLDGARIFNAAVALGVSASRLAAPCDSVTFALSKGLCCPAGSVLCGSERFIAAARGRRKQLGGAMRQSGVLAACGLVALESMVERLVEDHAHAARLATALSELDQITVDLEMVETNIVWFHCADPEWPARCRERGVALSGMCRGICRAVTHHGITDEEIEQALTIMAETL